jgi:peptidoglycan/LPS O-acetylase OafA/YrhL
MVNLGYLHFDWWEKQILIRFPEFAVGIIAAFYFIGNKKLPTIFSNAKGLVVAFIILYVGRTLQYEPLLAKLGFLSFMSKSIAPSVMCIGFGIILFHVITNTSFLSKILSSKVIVYLGKISFSIYLWHSLSIYLLRNILRNIKFGDANPFFAFILVTLLTILFAQISYIFLESFYFKLSNRNYKKVVTI